MKEQKLNEELNQELNQRFVQQEVRLRSLFKSDMQAAFRGEQQNTLSHAEALVAKATREARASVNEDLRKALQALQDLRTYVESRMSAVAEERNKNHQELLGLADNLETRLIENLDLHVAKAFVKTLEEYKANGKVFIPKLD